MYQMLRFNGQTWVDCCSNFHLTPTQRPVILRGQLARYVDVPRIGNIYIPPNVCILEVPTDIKDTLLALDIVLEVEASDCVTGYIWRL